MRAAARADGVDRRREPAASFESWIGRQQRPAATPAGAAAQRGAEIVVEGECAECHTIRGTQADGTDAPDLTHVASRPTLGAGAVANTEDDLTAWVTDPHAIKEGVKMPAPDLTAEQLDDMLAYLETLE
jgi:cytochrome c oxidase subunit 2